MDDFFAFLQRQDPEKYDLIKIAIAHHRFAWFHPFDNGNGRTVRLITYAMLIKMGFKVDKGRILNPTAVFVAIEMNIIMLWHRKIKELMRGCLYGLSICSGD